MTQLDSIQRLKKIKELASQNLDIYEISKKVNLTHYRCGEICRIYNIKVRRSNCLKFNDKEIEIIKNHPVKESAYLLKKSEAQIRHFIKSNKIELPKIRHVAKTNSTRDLIEKEYIARLKGLTEIKDIEIARKYGVSRQYVSHVLIALKVGQKNEK